MAKPFQFQRVRGLLRQDRALAVLLPEAERLAALDRRLAGAVPPPLARVCRVVAMTEGEVQVHCGNGAAAARLRSLADTLARALSTPELPVARLKIKVRADWSLPERPPKAGMAAAGLAAWQALDSQLPESELKAAVERLLRHQRRHG